MPDFHRPDFHSEARPGQDTEEPRCLIPPASRWYRPGLGFTCRQIMVPLMMISALALILLVLQGSALIRSDGTEPLRWLAVLIPALMLGLTIRAFLFVRRSLIDPLAQVRYWVSRVRGGEFSARMPTLATGEFNELAIDINLLADQVEALHGRLEAKVVSKTEILARKSQSLELLYEVVTLVNESQGADDVLRHFMHRLAQVFRAEAAVLRVFDDSGLVLRDSTGLGASSGLLRPVVHSRTVIDTSPAGDRVVGVRSETINEVLEQDRSDPATRQIVSVPLQHRDSLLGSYQLVIPSGQTMDDESREVLFRVGQHLGVMVEQSRLDQDTTRLLMVEERARLANELHDSLAQTLASLRFQVRVLDETLHQGDEQVTWEELEKLEEQVEIANAELRELMGQFRAPLQSREIVFSIEKLVQRFRRDTGVSVFFQNEWQDDDLSIEQRTQVIRIVQEALANIRKHANANSVRVLIRNARRGFRVVIEDDGLGYDERVMADDGPGNHIGRQIMRERAEALGAVLALESEPGEGSSVSLEYTNPESRLTPQPKVAQAS